MKVLAKQSHVLKRGILGVAICATLPLATITTHAIGAWGLDNTPMVDWGSCPCVNIGAAWSSVHGINNTTATFPYLLESVDQKQKDKFASSTNKLFLSHSEVITAVGEIDVMAPTSAGVLHCSAYNNRSDKEQSTTHAVLNAPVAVNDCRTGLYNIAEKTNPMPL